MSKLRALKIDVDKKEITEIEINPGKLKDIYAALDCDLFAVAGNFNQHIEKPHLMDSLYVDDEGLFDEDNPIFEFQPPGWVYQIHFAGNGLIVGHDAKTGDGAAASCSLAEAAKYVKWTNLTVKDL